MIIAEIQKDPIVTHIANNPNISENLVNLLSIISSLEKTIEDHLERKRIMFPRFFFLSNEELLNILAESRNLHSYQTNIKKCFEGIDELVSDEKFDINAIKSAEGEMINFPDPIQTKVHCSNVEKWLTAVETQMQLILLKTLLKAFQELKSNPKNFIPWAQKGPQQVILCANQLLWVENVENILASQNIEVSSSFLDFYLLLS